MMNTVDHIPVMLQEVIRFLQVQPGGHYVDCTVGTGGHANAILAVSSPGGQLLGLDTDPDAVKVAMVRLQKYENSVLLVNGSFEYIEGICAEHNFQSVNGVLFDLGISSAQLGSHRGFSFQKDAPLDMRFDHTQELTAADIVNTLPEDELASTIFNYSGERGSREIAKRIIKNRPVVSTLELTKIIESVVRRHKGGIHPATRTFQALRIAVNRELECLKEALPQAMNILSPRGRLVVISYHSLEDRIVKNFFTRESKDCICPPMIPECVCGHTHRLHLVTKKVVTPSTSEVKFNPRSRSAKLRAAERL